MTNSVYSDVSSILEHGGGLFTLTQSLTHSLNLKQSCSFNSKLRILPYTLNMIHIPIFK